MERRQAKIKNVSGMQDLQIFPCKSRLYPQGERECKVGLYWQPLYKLRNFRLVLGLEDQLRADR